MCSFVWLYDSQVIKMYVLYTIAWPTNDGICVETDWSAADYMRHLQCTTDALKFTEYLYVVIYFNTSIGSQHN